MHSTTITAVNNRRSAARSGTHRPRWAAVAILALLTGCQPETKVADPLPRPVRVMTVETREAGTPVTFTGHIEAEDAASLGFRIAGRVEERGVRIGDRVKPGQVVARLEAQNENNALRSARANLAATRAAYTQARNHFERQQTLFRQGWATRAQFDQAEKAQLTAQAQVDAAEVDLKVAYDLVSFTALKADAKGVVTAVGAEPGEVVQAGQMVVVLARQDGRDAVFDVPAQVLRTGPSDPLISVSLADAPSVKATGRVRQVAPQADPVTRTFEVKVGLTDPPAAMRLGAPVNGTLVMEAFPVIEIPASALTEADRQAAVWIVDPAKRTVSLRAVEVQSFSPANVAISRGLDVGEIIVTAGVQALHPGQSVRLLGLEP